MNRRCPVCGLHFEREPGYFLGAMYVSYAVSLVPVLLLIAIAWFAAGLPYEKALLAGALAYLPMVPLVLRLARVIWIHIDQALDAEK